MDSSPNYDFKDDLLVSPKEDIMNGQETDTSKVVADDLADLLTGFEPVSAGSDPLMHEDLGSPRMSTNRPLVTAVEENRNPLIFTSAADDSNLLDEEADIQSYDDAYSATAKTSVFANDDDDVLAPQPVGDNTVSIAEQEDLSGGFPVAASVESGSVRRNDDLSSTSVAKKTAFEKECDLEDLLPSVENPKIGTKSVSAEGNKETSILGACEPIAHSANIETKRSAAMEATAEGSATAGSDASCCFSPGTWFNPEKLHPKVAELVYWRDMKKSGITFGSTLVLLLSLKYFSCITVMAYLIVAVLAVTMSSRIYKSVLQAVQKSNEGPPFKEYLDMNINLSHENLKDVTEMAIHHVNCLSSKVRSLILVEDLFDTFKLLLFAWCMTYIGAWLNGMTVVILAFVSAFTLPKVYETNKTQIDTYAEIIRTKGKEVMEMINAKIPLGKKKKEE